MSLYHPVLCYWILPHNVIQWRFNNYDNFNLVDIQIFILFSSKWWYSWFHPTINIFFFFTYWYIFYFHLSLSFHLSSAVKGTLANNRAQLDSVLTLEPNRMGRILLLPPGCDVTFGQAVKFSTPKFSSADWDGNTAYFHRLLRSLNELTYIKPLKYYLHQ